MRAPHARHRFSHAPRLNTRTSSLGLTFKPDQLMQKRFKNRIGLLIIDGVVFFQFLLTCNFEILPSETVYLVLTPITSLSHPEWLIEFVFLSGLKHAEMHRF